jgi:thioredoxin reductase
MFWGELTGPVAVNLCMPLYDVVIVGAGPAGLSAALILGRSRRKVLVFYHAPPRNHQAHKVSGFLTQSEITPLELLEKGRKQLEPYSTVELVEGCVTQARRTEEGFFEVEAADGRTERGRKLLLATGLSDDLPELEGLPDRVGRSVFTCPYCDGYECCDLPLAVFSGETHGPDFALEMLGWSQNVVIVTNGHRLTPEDKQKMEKHGVKIRQEKIVRLEGEDTALQRIVFEEGEPLEVQAMFLATSQKDRGGPLAEQLAAEFDKSPGRFRSTNIPGLYVAGDTGGGVQMAIVAAGDGAQAAVQINQELFREGLKSD